MGKKGRHWIFKKGGYEVKFQVLSILNKFWHPKITNYDNLNGLLHGYPTKKSICSIFLPLFLSQSPFLSTNNSFNSLLSRISPSSHWKVKNLNLSDFSIAACRRLLNQQKIMERRRGYHSHEASQELRTKLEINCWAYSRKNFKDVLQQISSNLE